MTILCRFFANKKLPSTQNDSLTSDLAEKANVPQSAISRFDKNEQHKDIHLISISKALGLSIEDILDIEEVDEEKASE